MGVPTGVLLPKDGQMAVANPKTAELNKRLLLQMAQQPPELDLPLGPGDLIDISVFEVEELSHLKARIPLRGTIILPLIGPVQAAGRTAIELQDHLRQRLQQRYMHDPQVSVFVEEQRSQSISIVGAVRNGGIYQLSTRLRLADGLALAGGLADDADRVVYVIRRVPADALTQANTDGNAPGATGLAARPTAAPAGSALAAATPQPLMHEAMVAVDLEALVSGQAELNLPLQAGDVIHAPWAGSFYVGGEVQRPGSFLLKSRTTLDQAIVAAGGVKDVADWDDIRLYRPTASGEPEVQQFSMKAFEKGEVAPELHKNDVVIVGKSEGKAILYGLRDFFRFGWGASLPL
jgi:polysaccharide export outer membrane protein